MQTNNNKTVHHPYWDNITYSVLDGTNAGMHERHFETLTFQDILFTVMQKDYGMLDKFREYYDR